MVIFSSFVYNVFIFSFEKQVHDIMHKAFWDLLESEIKEDSPKYTHALSLMAEMKKVYSVDIIYDCA